LLGTLDVKDFEERRPSSSFEIGYAPARVADTKLRPQTPGEKAVAAATLAGDLERRAQFVRDDVAASEIAAAAEDLADWTDAENDAAVGLSHLRGLVKKAPAAKLDATDARVRASLEHAAQVLADTEALVAGVPGAPKLGAPIVRCADALRAVLPPGRPLGWEAERAVVEVVTHQATYSDLVALRAIVGERADHELALRFQQFSKVARKKLVRILCDRELEARARARQEAQRQARRAAAGLSSRAAAAATAQAEAPTDPALAANEVTDARSSTEVSRTASTGDVSQRSGGGPLPYRAELERSFGRSFAAVEAHTGMAAELVPLGAQALTVGNQVAFADTAPSPALVAHEAAHVTQNEQAGAHAAMASGVVAPRDSPAEAEADAITSQVAAHGPGVRLPPITAAPAAHVQLAPAAHAAPAAHVQLAPAAHAAGGTPLDRGTEAYALRGALAAHDGHRVLEILSRHADREAMYALRRAYGDTFGADLRARLTTEQFARARGIAGDQIALDVQLDGHDGHDGSGIFRDLERITGAQALGLVISSARPIVIATEIGPAAPLCTLTDVQAALRRRLPPDEYYRAMRLILEKAQRELVRDPQAVAADLAGLSASSGDTHKPEIMASAMKGTIAALGVDLAEERLRAADGKAGTKARSTPTLPLPTSTRTSARRSRCACMTGRCTEPRCRISSSSSPRSTTRR
jgi:hypothetical protein